MSNSDKKVGTINGKDVFTDSEIENLTDLDTAMGETINMMVSKLSALPKVKDIMISVRFGDGGQADDDNDRCITAGKISAAFVCSMVMELFGKVPKDLQPKIMLALMGNQINNIRKRMGGD